MLAEQRGNNNLGKETLSYSNIKFVYFDVGDVLLRFSDGLRDISNKVSLPYEDCAKIWLEMDDSICRGEANPQELWNRIKTAANYGGDDIDFIPFWVDHFQPIPEAHRLVQDLSQDREVGLLTNIYPGVYPLAKERGIIPNISYASVILSCDVSLIKPEQAIYELAETKTGLKPAEILFIDNNPRFISPAVSEGWETFLIEPEKINQNVRSLRNSFGI